MVRSIFILGFFVALSSQSSFVGSVPLSDTERASSEVKIDDSVRELENLKPLGTRLSMMKSQEGLFSDINGMKEAHSANTEEVKHNGKLVAKLFQQMDTDPDAPDKGGPPPARLRTELQIPGEAIHKSVVEQLPVHYSGLAEKGHRTFSNLKPSQEPRNSVELPSNVYGGTQQYTPLDMAEYVFWTGDEKGVSLAIQEFLQEGMMTREEAIMFLQEIKYNLDYLKNHYTRYGLNSREQPSTNTKEKQREDYQITRKPEVPREKNVGDQIRSELNQLRQLQEAYKKRSEDRDAATSYFTGSNQGKTSVVNAKSAADLEYEELLERLRLADFLYTEYSLEEVIYQLAKVMFTQSLTGGSAEAQQALSKFMNFLEQEAEQGHISRSLEKKVLDVLIASLSDTVSEHPELLTIKQNLPQTNDNIVGQKFLKQVLELSPEDKAFLQRALIPNLDVHKEQNDRSNLLNRNFQMKEKKMQLPFGLGK